MVITEEQAVIVANYACELRDLENYCEDWENNKTFEEHPEWNTLSEELDNKFSMTPELMSYLNRAWELGYCDYLSTDDILSANGVDTHNCQD